MAEGVNGRMAAQLGLVNSRPLLPKESTLQKFILLCTHPPTWSLAPMPFLLPGRTYRGIYRMCFASEGTGTFKEGPLHNPLLAARHPA